MVVGGKRWVIAAFFYMKTIILARLYFILNIWLICLKAS